MIFLVFSLWLLVYLFYRTFHSRAAESSCASAAVAVAIILLVFTSRCDWCIVVASVASICCCCDAAHSVFSQSFLLFLPRSLSPSLSHPRLALIFSLYFVPFPCRCSAALVVCTFKWSITYNVPKRIRTNPVNKSVLERNSIETVVCLFPFFAYIHTPAHILYAHISASEQIFTKLIDVFKCVKPLHALK